MFGNIWKILIINQEKYAKLKTLKLIRKNWENKLFEYAFKLD